MAAASFCGRNAVKAVKDTANSRNMLHKKTAGKANGSNY
jgi:hypothetical protein